MFVSRRRTRSAPDVASLSLGDGRTSSASSSASSLSFGPGLRRAASNPEFATEKLRLAEETAPQAGVYPYLATCRDAVHATRDFILRAAWTHPERIREVLATDRLPTTLSPTRAGTLVAVPYLAVLSAATKKACRPFHSRLGPRDRGHLRALARELNAGLRSLPSLQTHLAELARLEAFDFGDVADPAELRSLFQHKVQINCLAEHDKQCEVRGRYVDHVGPERFWHPVALLGLAAGYRFAPNACPSPPPTPGAPPAPVEATAVTTLVNALMPRLCRHQVDPGGVAAARLVADLLPFVYAQAASRGWSGIAELARQLGARANALHFSPERVGLLATLLHGAALHYAAAYLSRLRTDDSRMHLVNLMDTLGNEIRKWPQFLRGGAFAELHDDLEVLCGLVRAGFAQRTAFRDLANNVDSFERLLQSALRPRFVEGCDEDVGAPRRRVAASVLHTLRAAVAAGEQRGIPPRLSNRAVKVLHEVRANHGHVRVAF